LEQQRDVRALRRVLRRESHGLTWRQQRVQAPAAAVARRVRTAWASPDAMVRFRNGMARKEGSTEAGIAWFMAGD
jgi:hypothetical protein